MGARETMKTSARYWALLLGALSCVGCSLALRREHDQCHTSQDCQSLAVGAVCSQSGICEQLVAPPQASGEAQACSRDADCTNDAWSVCRHGTCKALATNGCITLSASGRHGTRDRLPLAVLVPAAELTGGNMGAELLAASFAIDELRRGFDQHGEPFPEVVAVACDENDTAAYAHLVDAGVRVLVGPMRAGALESARMAVNGQAVLFSPYAEGPELEMPARSPTSSVVSCKPNRSGAKASLLAAVSFVQAELHRRALIAEDGEAVLALSETERQLGLADLFGKADLASASLRKVTYTNVPPGGGLVSELKREAVPPPSLVVAASAAEDWSELIAAVDDSARFAQRPYPFYLLADKQASVGQLLGQVNGSDHPLTARTVGLDYTLSADNTAIHRDFEQAFTQGTGLPFEPGLDYVRDCSYLATYAAVAGQLRYALAPADLGSEAVLDGLRAFTGGGRRLPTGDGGINRVLQELQDKRGFDAAVQLIGGSGDLDLLGVLSVEEVASLPAGQYVHPAPRDQQLYCADATATFPATKLVFPSSGAAPGAEAAGTFSCLDDARP